MTFQAIRDLHTQSQSSSSWNTYLASRKATKNQDRASHSEVLQKKPAASPVENPRPFAAPATSLRSVGDGEKVGHNKCCDKKGNHI